LLTYEQNTRHLTLPRGFASFAATAEAHKATRVQKWRVLADCTIPPFDRRALFKVGMVEIGGAAGAGALFRRPPRAALVGARAGARVRPFSERRTQRGGQAPHPRLARRIAANIAKLPELLRAAVGHQKLPAAFSGPARGILRRDCRSGPTRWGHHGRGWGGKHAGDKLIAA